MSDRDHVVKDEYCAFYYSKQCTQPFEYGGPRRTAIKAQIQAKLSANHPITLLGSKFSYSGVGFLLLGGPGANNSAIKELLYRLGIPCDEVHPVSEL